jgi:hypothetical protein
MKPKIAIVCERPLSDRDKHRFGVEILSEFFDVSVLECSQITRPQSQLDVGSKNDLLPKLHYQTSFKSQREFFRHVQGSSILFYIDVLGSNLPSLRIRRALKLSGALRIKMFLGVLPWVSSPIDIMGKLRNLWKSGRLCSKIIEQVSARCTSYFEPKVDVFIYSGNESRVTRREPESLEIWAHSFDYQYYLQTKSKKSKFESLGQYVVFIDQCAPSHPDYAFHGNVAPVSEDIYYSSINAFFEVFERIMGIKIVISAHPRRKSTERDFWEGRQVVIGKTPELISGAKLVISHYSTALSFAVLNRKPILQITTDEYINSYRREQFLAFSQALSLNLLNVDRYSDDEINASIFDVNEDVYLEYQERYIKAEQSDSCDIWYFVANSLGRGSYNSIEE